MGAAILMPVEDYLRLTEKPSAEYRDGVVTQKPMPTHFHSIVQTMLVLLLRAQGARALTELTVCLSPSRYLVPDVCVAESFEGRYPTEPVRLCCEIVSPENRIGAMLNKCEEYHAWGVPNCWVIDPERRSAWEYHAGSEPVRVAGALTAGPWTVMLSDLFAELPER